MFQPIYHKSNNNTNNCTKNSIHFLPKNISFIKDNYQSKTNNNSIPKVNGIILIYSVSSKNSLINLFPFLTLINHYSYKEKMFIVLIGNKKDNKRLASFEEGKQFANKLNCQYYETTKTNTK